MTTLAAPSPLPSVQLAATEAGPASPTRDKFTPDDLLRLPDSQSTELVDGKLVEKNVSYLSADFESSILVALRNYSNARGDIANVLSNSLGYRCFPDDPDRVRKPDVTVVTLDRINALSDPNPGFMPIVPDLAVEVISTNDTVTEIDEKLLEYRTAGFPLVWLVDPIARHITVYPNPGKPFLLTEEDEIRCENALPGFACKVADLFPRSA